MMKDGKGICKVTLSSAASDRDTVRKIRDGIIRNISVGYLIHGVDKTPAADAGGVAKWDAFSWEPMEISAVACPADSGAQFRSHGRSYDTENEAQRGYKATCRLLSKPFSQAAYAALSTKAAPVIDGWVARDAAAESAGRRMVTNAVKSTAKPVNETGKRSTSAGTKFNDMLDELAFERGRKMGKRMAAIRAAGGGAQSEAEAGKAMALRMKRT